MNDNERTVWDNLLTPCKDCYYANALAYPLGYAQSILGRFPPHPDELMGYLIDEGAMLCRYCIRVNKLLDEDYASGAIDSIAFLGTPIFPFPATKQDNP